ncbi:aminoalcoholphosphotransferase [Actinidia rufa]|uniref:Aminoalcoholphosphotransferase n=1 Tax=Actinidia rufa TaxID=165716 RepID=A0A7J0F889_9ERIC|nr:aminoalcoholphosphotransferase [Actinidia rufa]
MFIIRRKSHEEVAKTRTISVGLKSNNISGPGPGDGAQVPTDTHWRHQQKNTAQPNNPKTSFAVSNGVKSEWMDEIEVLENQVIILELSLSQSSSLDRTTIWSNFGQDSRVDRDGFVRGWWLAGCSLPIGAGTLPGLGKLATGHYSKSCLLQSTMGYIGSHGVAALHRYKYSGVDHSYVANMFYSPSGVASLISSHFGWHYTYRVHVLGLICIAWLYVFTSLGFGSTQMGSFYAWITSLLISGCDALACAFETIAFGSTAMCGRSTIWFWVISAIPFYGATWEHYFTNTLILPTVNGPTEGLMLIYLGHFFTAIVGAEWWAQHVGKALPFLSWVPFLNGLKHFPSVYCMQCRLWWDT